MKIKLLTALFFVLTFASLGYSEIKTCKIDLNNDGKEEVISVEDRFDRDTEGVISVMAQDGKISDSFSVPDHLGEVEFVSLNNDGARQIAARSYGGVHYTNLAVYGYKDNKLYEIFETGSGCGIDTDFKSNPAKIKVGIAKFEQEGWSYADEPDWEVYTWTGREFSAEK